MLISSEPNPTAGEVSTPTFRGVVAALSRKSPRSGLGRAVFGARLAHEAYPPAHRRPRLRSPP